jgi:hypothetical protein
VSRGPSSRRGNERARSFLSLHTCCNVCIASGANVYVSSCRDGAAERAERAIRRSELGERGNQIR